jgi:hypothetical protein
MSGMVLLKILSNLVLVSLTLVHDTGENLIVPGSVELYPTYTAVGIELPYTEGRMKATGVTAWT